MANKINELYNHSLFHLCQFDHYIKEEFQSAAMGKLLVAMAILVHQNQLP
jgi:ssRNA-specific RNase YbeY (16S rRNA maturation enzyme)